MSFSRRNFLVGGIGLVAAGAYRPVIAQASSLVPAMQGAATGTALSAQSSDGLNLSIRAYGPDGAPEILFLHGLGQSRLAWDRQVGGLADRFRIITWDLRGHGDSDKPTSVSAYSEASLWADDVAAVIEVAQLRHPTIVGWSLGGYVVGQYLAHYGASRIAGVNLVDAVTKFDYQLFGSSGLEYSPDLTSPDLAIRTEAIVNFLAACFAKTPPADDFNRMVAYNGMVPVEVHAGIGQMSAQGVDEAFAAVSRLLITYGAKDTITALEMSRRLLDLNPAAKMLTYDDAGHAPFYDDPARFNIDLAAFAAP